MEQLGELLTKKGASLCGLQRLHKALVETQEIVGVRGCIGEPWFKPDWERLATYVHFKWLIMGNRFILSNGKYSYV